jgi:hypothetical protein
MAEVLLKNIRLNIKLKYASYINSVAPLQTAN